MRSKVANHFIFCSAVLVLALPQAFAQRLTVELKDIEVRQQQTPDYSETGYARARAKKQDWVQIVLLYSTDGARDGWLDELTLNWHVLLPGGKTERLHMTSSVTYIDIPNGDEHYAIMYVRPNTIKRYYAERGRITARNVAVYVEALVGGVRVGSLNANKTTVNLPDGWYRSPTLKTVPYGLLSRDKTPFAPLDWDFFENIRPREE